LSNGETRRLSFATALIKNPKILLMDQPLTGLDKETRDDFGAMLSDIIASGIHILMSTHNDEIPSCITNVGFLSEKNISIVGKAGDVIQNHQNWRSEGN
jgi:molybdate transport system ATP-binding protein